MAEANLLLGHLYHREFLRENPSIMFTVRFLSSLLILQFSLFIHYCFHKRFLPLICLRVVVECCSFQFCCQKCQVVPGVMHRNSLLCGTGDRL